MFPLFRCLLFWSPLKSKKYLIKSYTSMPSRYNHCCGCCIGGKGRFPSLRYRKICNRWRPHLVRSVSGALRSHGAHSRLEREGRTPQHASHRGKLGADFIHVFALSAKEPFYAQTSNRWRYSISNVNQQLTICQEMLKTWCINIFLFAMLCKKLVH